MGYNALSSLELIELIISQWFWSICVQIYGRTILRWHLVACFNGRVVPENDFSLRGTLLLTVAVPNQHGLLTRPCYRGGRRSSNLPGPLQVELFLSVCVGCTSIFNCSYFCQIWLIWNEIFRAWYLRRHCSEKQNDSAISEYGWGKTCVVLLILKNSVDPPLLVPSPLLCHVVLFCFVFFNCPACCQWSPVLITRQCEPVCSLTQIQGLQNQAGYLEAELAGGNKDRRRWDG